MTSAPHHYTILFHLLKEQIWPIHFHPEKYPVSPTAESKQLIMVTKTLDIQALAICAATFHTAEIYTTINTSQCYYVILQS